MNAVLIIALTNAVLVTGMFAIVAACKSRIHNPVVLHWLWILVLLKLLTPPLWARNGHCCRLSSRPPGSPRIRPFLATRILV